MGTWISQALESNVQCLVQLEMPEPHGPITLLLRQTQTLSKCVPKGPLQKYLK
jgi:hypothetical protein